MLYMVVRRSRVPLGTGDLDESDALVELLGRRDQLRGR